jgi:hypothetical protein
MLKGPSLVVLLCFALSLYASYASYASYLSFTAERSKIREMATHPAWAASCTFRPMYAPICETAYPGKWYLKLAEQGKLRNAHEQYALGQMYYEGNAANGLAIDAKKAVKWFRKAAAQGNADAQAQLDRIF